MSVSFHLLVLLAVGFGLLLRAGKLVKRRHYVRLFGELYVPFFLWTVYGLRSFTLFFEDGQTRFNYAAVDFSDLDIFLGFLVMSGAIVAIPLGFRIAFRDRNTAGKHTSRDGRDWRAAKVFLAVALIFDAVARAKLIEEGAYFSWLGSDLILAGQLVPGGAVAQMQDALEPLIGALLCLQALRSKKWLPVLGGFLFLVLLKGQRDALFSVGIATALTYLAYSVRPPDWRRILAFGGGAVILAGLASAAIVDLRFQYRTDRSQALNDPGAFVMDMVLVQLPAAIRQDVDSHELDRQSGLYARLSMWQGSFASEINRMRHGWRRMPVREFGKALTLPIPSALFPGEKPTVTQGVAASTWYATGWNKSNPDPGTTIFSDIFRFAGPAGVVVLGLIYGLLNGTFGRFIVGRYGAIGPAVFFGSVGVMSVRANSYAALLVGVRNLTILILLLEVAWSLSRLVRRSKLHRLELHSGGYG